MNPKASSASYDLSALWALAAERFALGPSSLHGPDHWQRVERNGLEIAAESGADVPVVRLFAVLHDSKRLSEGHDPEHGARAAAWAAELREAGRIELSDAQFGALREACIYHDKGRVSGDATIGTCLGRRPARPDPLRHSTRRAVHEHRLGQADRPPRRRTSNLRARR